MQTSQQLTRTSGGGCFIYGFCIVFSAIGLGFFVGLTGLPLSHMVQAKGWEPVPCTITQSRVKSSSSSDGTTYSVNIRYDYQWQGRQYHGDRYNFVTGSSSGRSRKQAIVSRFPAGSAHTCYVNPSDPTSAVLNRDFTAAYLIGCFGLLFVGFGALVFFLIARSRKAPKSISARASRKTGISAPQSYPQGAVTLKASNNRWVIFIFLLIFAGIWNSVTWVGVFQAVGGGGSGFSAFPALFMIPFLLVGLGTLAGVVYVFLSLFNPRPEAVLSSGYLPLGGTASLEWSFRGNSSRIRQLTITLEGQEKATYRRGTNTTTDTSTFEKIVLVDTRMPKEIAYGEVQVIVPEFTAPSFDASNNKIVWLIKFHGDIPRWPDVKDEFPFQVAPLPLENTGIRQPSEFREM